MSTETRRGGRLLCHDGYKYTKHKKLADGAWRWQCTDRKKKSCRGAAHADEYGYHPTVKTDHNHPRDAVAVKLVQHRAEIRHVAQSSTAKPHVSYLKFMYL